MEQEINIEDLPFYLEEGEWEIKTDEGFKPITEFIIKLNKLCFRIKTENFVLECSYDHLIEVPGFIDNSYFYDGKFWILCSNLNIGDSILTVNGIETLLSIENIGTHTTYDLSIDSKTHQYFANGVSSHNTGKTSRVIHLIQDFINPVINPFYQGNLVILYDSWEMPDWRNVIRMYSDNNKITVKELLSYQERLQQDKIDLIVSASGKLKHAPIWFNSINQSVSDWIKRKKHIYALLLEKNPQVQIVNIVDHTRLVKSSNEKTEEQLITSFMKAGMELKNEFGMINFFLSQMNRNIESGERKDIAERAPVAADIFGADSVFQCADCVIVLHRPGLYGVTKYKLGGDYVDIVDRVTKDDFLMLEYVLKQRDGWTGSLAIRHDLKYNNFSNFR